MDIVGRTKPQHLRLILKIAETGKLQLAAQSLAMSQPAASRILIEIERLVGHALFERHPKGMEVTPFGLAFVRHAQLILAEMQSLENELQYLATGELGEVRVGAVTGPAVRYLMPAVQEVTARSPSIRIDVDVAPSGELVQQLVAGNFDFVIGRLPAGQDDRNFHIYPARTESVVLLVHAAHPLAKRRSLELHELIDFPWVIQKRGLPIREVIESTFHHEGLAMPMRVLNSSSLLVALTQVANVHAIAPQTAEVLDFLTNPEIRANFVALDLEKPITVPPYFVIRDRNRKLSRAAQRLLKEVLNRI